MTGTIIGEIRMAVSVARAGQDGRLRPMVASVPRKVDRSMAWRRDLCFFRQVGVA